MRNELITHAPKDYACDGISTRRHNEPGGYQEVWHHHQHIFPRLAGDKLYAADDRIRLTTSAQRLPFANKLRDALEADSAGLTR